MTDTKRRILDKSLELFNAKGSDQTTVRHIAAELGMSHGNLCYHFPNVDDIVQKLYEELVEKLSARIAKAQEFSLAALFGFTESTFVVFYAYRFILVEFVGIMRRIPAIRMHFQMLQTQRRQELTYLFGKLQQDGMMKPEQIPGQHLMLIEQLMLTGNFWMSEAEILSDEADILKIRKYARLFNSIWVPYLTDEGLLVYQQYYVGE